MHDHSEERRQQAQICIAKYQKQIRVAHHKKVKPMEFQIRVLILRRVIQRTRPKDHRKLRPNWEGPYIIIASGGNMSYTLVDQGRSQLNKQLNSFHLKRYYM